MRTEREAVSGSSVYRDYLGELLPEDRSAYLVSQLAPVCNTSGAIRLAISARRIVGHTLRMTARQQDCT